MVLSSPQPTAQPSENKNPSNDIWLKLSRFRPIYAVVIITSKSPRKFTKVVFTLRNI